MKSAKPVPANRENDLWDGIAAAMTCLSAVQDYSQWSPIDLRPSIQAALAAVGEALAVDRACIFENSFGNPQDFDLKDLNPETGETPLAWEWVGLNTQPELSQQTRADVAGCYLTMFPQWQAQLSQGQGIVGCIADFSLSEQPELQAQQIGSLMVMPIQVWGTLWGVVGFEDRRPNRLWSHAEQAMVRAFAGGLGNAIAQVTGLEQQVKVRTADLWQTIEDLERKAVKYENVEGILRQSESRFQKLAANAPGMLYQLRLAPDGSVSFPYVSSGCWDIFGYQPGEVRRDGALLLNAVHPEDQEYYLASLHYSAETLRTWKWEGRMLTASGAMKWIQGSSRPEQQKDGSVVWDGLLMDVSDRKAAEAKIHESYNLLNSVINGTSDHIFVKDTKGRYVLVNESLLRTFGISGESIIGKDDWSIFPSGEAQKIIKMDQAMIESGISRTFEETVVVKGKTRTFLTTKTPYYDREGKPAGLIGITRDMTDRKQAEEALKVSEAQLRQQAEDLQQTLRELRQTQAHLVHSEKMSSLGQLVAGIAHEINNPVNFIYGNVHPANEYTQDLLRIIDLYQSHYPDPPAELEAELEDIDLSFLAEDLPKILKSMEVGAERIKAIVNSLRSFSRMDEAAMKAVDLHEGIESSLMILQNRLKATMVRSPQQEYYRPDIDVIKHYGELPLVECYAGQLNQVFMNLLLNAIDAIDEKMQQDSNYQPQITIRTGLTRSSQVTIRFSDNGLGIPNTVKSRIFDPFFTTKSVGKGTGMGLSISYQIITEQHGGTLQCLSIPGQGAEFVITIPLQQEGTT